MEEATQERREESGSDLVEGEERRRLSAAFSRDI